VRWLSHWSASTTLFGNERGMFGSVGLERLSVMRSPFADEHWHIGRIFLETFDIRRDRPRLRETDPELRNRCHYLRLIQCPGADVYDFGIRKHFRMGAGQAMRTNMLAMHCATAAGSIPPKGLARHLLEISPQREHRQGKGAARALFAISAMTDENC
jgi:hypothetical protein